MQYQIENNMKIGDKVKYVGDIDLLKNQCNEMKIVGIVRDGEQTAYGETNISGKTLYSCSVGKLRMLFFEEELEKI